MEHQKAEIIAFTNTGMRMLYILPMTFALTILSNPGTGSPCFIGTHFWFENTNIPVHRQTVLSFRDYTVLQNHFEPLD